MRVLSLLVCALAAISAGVDSAPTAAEQKCVDIAIVYGITYTFPLSKMQCGGSYSFGTIGGGLASTTLWSTWLANEQCDAVVSGHIYSLVPSYSWGSFFWQITNEVWKQAHNTYLNNYLDQYNIDHSQPAHTALPALPSSNADWCASGARLFTNYAGTPAALQATYTSKGCSY